MARQVEQKLRVTAALLGTTALKDLAAAFRRINASTSFEIGRAHKWMQGPFSSRASCSSTRTGPQVLGLNWPGQWIADCDLEMFVDEICARHGRSRDALLRAGDPGLSKRAGLGRRADGDLCLLFPRVVAVLPWAIDPGRIVRRPCLEAEPAPDKLYRILADQAPDTEGFIAPELSQHARPCQ